MKKILKEFRVSDVFRHDDSKCIPQKWARGAKVIAFDHNEKCIISPDILKGKFLTFPFSEGNFAPLNTSLSSIGNSLLSEDIFFILLYLFIIEPKMGKELLGFEFEKEVCYLFPVLFRKSYKRLFATSLDRTIFSVIWSKQESPISTWNIETAEDRWEESAGWGQQRVWRKYPKESIIISFKPDPEPDPWIVIYPEKNLIAK
ncbi:hypothetical protein IPF86_00540 [Candidatus Nomurabacteria bacterium]|jgi:hypothetical protein|nr:MAG: hypothetical protein IPF86_00540 [Candidatus Nomurabacteria bacterium]